MEGLKILEAKYEGELEFPGGGEGEGEQNKKTFCGGVWIFSGTTHYKCPKEKGYTSPFNLN